MSGEVLLVLGPHRSGTSLFAGLAESLSFRPAAQNLMPPSDANPTGYFEDARIVALNDEVLKQLGFRWWDALGPVWDGRQIADLANHRLKACQYLEEVVRSQPRLLLKDPRICLTLPFWLDVFNDIGMRVEAVLVLRDMELSALSLVKRDGFSDAHACLITLSHMMHVLKYSQNLVKGVFQAEKLTTSPEAVMSSVSQCISSSMGVDHSRLSYLKENFIKPAMLKSRAGETSIAVPLELAKLVVEVQRLALDICNDSQASEIENLWSAWSDQISGLDFAREVRGPRSQNRPLPWNFNDAVHEASTRQRAAERALAESRQALLKAEEANVTLANENKELGAAITAIRSSWSWRITKPLRVFLRLWRL